MKPRGVWVLLALMALATVMFGIGVAIEKSTAAPAVVAAHQEISGGESGETAGAQSSAANPEALFGIDPESARLVAAAILGSALLGVGVWLYWRRREVLWAVGAGMAAFALLDVVELARQTTENHIGLAILAGTVAILHAAAAAMAIRLATAGSSTVRTASS